MPGVLTALAGIITALTGLVAILVQTGVLGDRDKTPPSVSQAAVSPSPSSSTSATKPAGPTTPTPVVDGAATGVSDKPIARSTFTGAVVTLQDGPVTKLRDEIREYCQGRPVLVTLAGQTIEMQRMKRFDVSDWRSGKGTVHIVLNSGDAIDAKISACYFVGVNDLGEFRADFENIRSVEFVR